MSFGANWLIAYMMFIEFFKETFGSGVNFHTEPPDEGE